MNYDRVLNVLRQRGFACAPAPLSKRSGRTGWLRRGGLATLVALIGLAVPHPVAADDAGKSKSAPVLTEDNEIRIGRENAEENDKQVKLVTDAAMVERVNRIGKEIAEAANKYAIPAKWGSSQLKQFQYTFKIVDDKDVNAYSLPGGFIYVNKGLLNYVRSDDELAGVLAHEVSHAAHHHMVKLMREQNKIQNILLPAVIAILAASKSGANDAAHLLIASQLYLVAKINTYGVEAEKDADRTGLTLLTHTKYNPVGLYSFMLRMAVDERNHTYGELGIYQTHPPGKERAEAAKQFLEDQVIPLRLSDVDPTLLASVSPVEPDKGAKNGSGGTGKSGDGKPADTGEGKGKPAAPDLVEIKISGIVLCRIAGVDGQTATERAQKVTKQINALMDTRLQPFEVRLNRDKTRLLIRSVYVLNQSDADAQGKTLTEIAHDMADAVAQISQKQQLESGM